MRNRAVLALLVVAGVTLAGGAVWAALGDLVFERRAGAQQGNQSIMPSIFPHWVHRARYRCYVCHPKIFKMELGSSEISMTAIRQGKFCGQCHNGRAAFNVEFQTCSRCHRAPSGE